MTDDVALADASYFDWSRIWAASVDGGAVTEFDGVLLALTGAPQEWWNIAFITRPIDEPDTTLARIGQHFEDRSQPFIIRIREGLDPAFEHAAEALGYENPDTMPGMVLAPMPEPPSAPDGLEIRRAADPATLEDCVVTAAEGFDMELDAVRELMPMDLVTQDSWETYGGYVDGRPAATAALVHSNGIAGVTFVATREAFRRRGFGEAITWHTVRRGLERGCTSAVLQASRMGYPIYQRMGFRHVCNYKTFVLPQYRS